MDLSHVLNLSELINLKDKIKRIFFYRVCGTGMGNVAVLMKQMGYEVEGGDKEFYPPMDSYLDEMGIKRHELESLKNEFFQKFDLIVVGNVVGRNSDDARFLESLKIPLTSFPCALGALVLQDKKVIGISGTHGKTTTSYFMVQMLEKLGISPGYLIGGVIGHRPSARIGNSDYFVIESDEYDSAYFHKMSKFHFYNISYLVLTSLEFDHGDIFSNLEDIENEFIDLFPQIKENIILSEDYPSIVKLYKNHSKQNSSKKWYFYGEKSKMGPIKILAKSDSSRFSLMIKGKEEEFVTNLIGKHNILNLSSCIILLASLSFETEKIKEVILDLQMVKRRQEEKGKYKEALVIDDFAHHPTAVATTIEGLKKKYDGRKIITVFAPTSATSRSNFFQNEFASSLMESDEVIFVKPLKPTTLRGCQDFDSEKLISDLSKKGINVEMCSSLEELIQVVDKVVDKYGGSESLLAFLSNGSIFGLWNSPFAEKIKG